MRRAGRPEVAVLQTRIAESHMFLEQRIRFSAVEVHTRDIWMRRKECREVVDLRLPYAAVQTAASLAVPYHIPQRNTMVQQKLRAPIVIVVVRCVK